MLWIVVGAFALSWGLTWRVRRIALTGGLLDHPNERSSHSIPTPRGGGLAIVVTTTVGLGLLWWAGEIDLSVFLAASGGGVAIAIVGFLDDRRPLSPGVRLAVHLCAAVWALVALGGLPPLRIGARLVSFGPEGYAVGTLLVTWALNLFNFMDGIDGIAASEGVFVLGGAAGLALIGGHLSGSASIELLAAAACAGFGAWNWPPARIFMGDVGSGYLGYLIGVLAVAEARTNPVALWIWVLLGGVFVVDATVTLLRRMARGERVHQAHRSHAYQVLSRRLASHRSVTVGVILVNLLWLLPAAWLADHFPEHAAWITIGALLPVVALALAAGAGRSERPASP